jgi:hypothetical protein
MKSLIIFFLLISLTAAATAASIDATEVVSGEDEESSSDKLQIMAASFVETFGNEPKVSGYVGMLLANLDKNHLEKALRALHELGSLDLSRKQLFAYGALLNEAVLNILKYYPQIESKQVGAAFDQMVGFLQNKNYLAASNAGFEALGYVEPGSEAHTLLKGILKSYNPLVRGIDFAKFAETGEWKMD